MLYTGFEFSNSDRYVTFKTIIQFFSKSKSGRGLIMLCIFLEPLPKINCTSIFEKFNNFVIFSKLRKSS